MNIADRWLAIKNGQVVGDYATKEEARKYGDTVLSPLVPITSIPDDDCRLINMEEYALLLNYVNKE